MIKSMTAFASAEVFKPTLKVRIEAKSYNSRYLDISLKIKQGYQSIEENIKRLIAKKIDRGRIEAEVSIECGFEDLYRYEVNMPKAKAYFEALNLLNRIFDLDGININTLTSIGGIIQPMEVNKNYDQVFTVVAECLDVVMLDLNKMRLEEGNNIANDLDDRLKYIENVLERVKPIALGLPKLCTDKLKERIQKLTKGLIEINQDRVLQEVFILAAKSDISEEIIRTASHIKQFRSIMRDRLPAGKRLNFLAQEFNREFNTIASKISEPEVSYMIVSVKSELEKIREQVQNVE